METTYDVPDVISYGREVAAVFRSEDGLTSAVDDLQQNGVDRARLSVLATGTPEKGAKLRAAGFATVLDVLSAADVPRTSYTQPEDLGTAKGAIISGLVYLGATLGAGLAAAAAGPALAPIIAGAVASGAAGGGVGAFLSHRLGGIHARYIEESLAHGGLVLWVRVKSAEDELSVIDLLTAAAGEHVVAQNVP